jgi:PQQ-dependent dehydrogenase (methanol/ethanol family)
MKIGHTSMARSLQLGLVAIAAVTAVVAGAEEARPPDAATADAGPFNATQASQGKIVYARACASCHGVALTGGSAPPLKGREFEASWSHPQVTLDDLLFIQRTTMPPRASRSVSPEDHEAVFAYILEMNGYEAGTTAAKAGAPGLLTPPRWVAAWPTIASGLAVDNTPLPGPGPGPPEFVAADAGATPGSGGPDQATLTAAAGSTDWLHYTHDYAGTRFSPLSEIDGTNARRLAPACVFQVGEPDNFQTGPLVHAGTMYLTTWRSTIALDAATCRPKWRHTWEPRGSSMWQRNRGVALKDGRLVRGTPDGYLLAVSAETGALLWARRVARPEAGETFTMAPLLYDDLVLIGPGGSENNVQGWVGAFRLADGAPIWRFNTVPRPGEPGYETWKSPKGTPRGGGAVWTSFSLDVETGDLYVPVTNPAPDLPAHLREGENLYTNSIVCLDVRTGKRRWHRSLVPADSHDWDLSHASPLLDGTVGGKARRLVVTTGKDGILRTLDRESHEVLYQTPVTTIGNADTPVTTTPLRVCPGILGGVEWSDTAFNPATNLLYVPAVDWCATFAAFEETRFIPGKLYMGGTADLDPPERSQGWVTAIDAATGTVKWKYRSPRPMLASVTTTAGNLLLTGELTGDFLALDARTGHELYRFNTGGPMGGGIVTYAVGGRQYIAATSGSPSNLWVDKYRGSPTVVVFRLP